MLGAFTTHLTFEFRRLDSRESVETQLMQFRRCIVSLRSLTCVVNDSQRKRDVPKLVKNREIEKLFYYLAILVQSAKNDNGRSRALKDLLKRQRKIYIISVIRGRWNKKIRVTISTWRFAMKYRSACKVSLMVYGEKIYTRGGNRH